VRRRVSPPVSRWRELLRDNGLSLVLAVFFLACWGGQTWSGFLAWNEELAEHSRAQLSLGAYLRSGHFLEATFENWESEFLQMGLFVLLTVRLFQRGSSESKDPDAKEPVDDEPHGKQRASAPWPVRRGGLALKLYEHSLSGALLLAFAAAFLLHAFGGLSHLNEERALDGQPPESLGEYVGSSRFWYESLQNWQSEFLAVLAIVVLSIFLRERGSPQSKPVAAPHGETGE
jgi:hypothetical protein